MGDIQVKGHTSSQEAIARKLSGINNVPPKERDKMVSRAAKIGWECDKKIDKLIAFVEEFATVKSDMKKEEYPRIILQAWVNEAQALLKDLSGDKPELKN